LAAEALRGVGGIMLNKAGERFCNELGTRDYVTGEMWKNKQEPFRLVLNSASGKEIEWHCKHYTGRGLMKRYDSGAQMARDMGIPADKLAATFAAYNQAGQKQQDRYGRKYFSNLPYSMDDSFWVAIICPVVHYCMGGLEITPDAEVKHQRGHIISGLFASGEVAGGIHGINRLGGSSLLDCVVFGRQAGAASARYLLQSLLQSATGGGSGPFNANVSVDPTANKVNVEIVWGASSSSPASSSAPSTTTSSSSSSSNNTSSPPASAPASSAAAPSARTPSPKKEEKGGALRTIGMSEVAKHNTEKDCWVVVNGQVLNVTGFLKNHPGGKQAILLFAGKDATAEFNMLHKPDVVQKYAPETVIGVTAAGGSASVSHAAAVITSSNLLPSRL